MSEEKTTASDELQLIGVLWSVSLDRALIITTDKIIIVKDNSFFANCEVYLGLGSDATEAERQRAHATVTKLISKEKLELQKGEILKIMYHPPSFLFNGYVTFKTAQNEIKVKTGSTDTIPIHETLRKLVLCLITFASDRFYNEGTGALIIDEVKKKD